MRYFDSGVLVKLYHQEPNSALAVAHIQAVANSITLTPLHLVEIRSALRLMEGRGEISPHDCQQALAAFDQDRAPAFTWNRRSIGPKFSRERNGYRPLIQRPLVAVRWIPFTSR